MPKHLRAPDADSLCRGAAVVQPTLSYGLDARDELFVKLGLAAGNGLNQVSPWVLAPWAADLEDSVEDINGSGRSYLLTAWYKHGFVVNDTAAVATTFGLLDSTGYLDQNAYVNDEYTQFRNEALTNAGTYQLPSYAPGAAITRKTGHSLGDDRGRDDVARGLGDLCPDSRVLEVGDTPLAPGDPRCEEAQGARDHEKCDPSPQSPSRPPAGCYGRGLPLGQSRQRTVAPTASGAQGRPSGDRPRPHPR
jgi:hypothetical protein